MWQRLAHENWIRATESILIDLPRHDNDKVHDVPCVSQVTAAVKNKAQGQNFQGRLHCKNAQEIGLRGFLEKPSAKLCILKEVFKKAMWKGMCSLAAFVANK